MAPRSEEQFETLREKSREKIIAAATELFARYGYHATSISTIAKKARISKGLLYNYFKSKDALLDAIITSAMEEGAAPLLMIREVKDPFEKIRLIVHGSFSMMKSEHDRRHWQFLLSIMTQYDVMKKMNKHFAMLEKMYLPMLQQIFREIGVPNPKLESYRFGALLDGISLHYLNVLPVNYPIDDLANEIILSYEKYRRKKK